MIKQNRLFGLFLILCFLLSSITACQPAPDKDVLYVNLTWHQHQPLYYKNEDGVYTRPWVRAHATKDYLDMAQKVAQFEDVHVTFNLTPSLMRQLNDIANGAKDIYWVLGERPVSELSAEDKRFILDRFFDVNWDNIIARYPRFQELLGKRGGTDEASIDVAMDSFTDQDFLDLQVWFNLAWFDPVFLAEEPLLSLVEKGEGFAETDKEIIFTKVMEVVQEVIPYHNQLQDSGQIEVTTTPYAHPILPLIYNNQLALVGNPSAEMPETGFAYSQDAEQHLALSVEMYAENFDTEVRGLWPGEGAVAQDIVGMIADAGYTYMQTGEPVLAKSLGIESFTRDSEGFVREADDLYRPYYVQDDEGNQVAMFFRDWTLSDNIGFVYTGMSGEAGAADLINHLELIQADFVEAGVEGPHIISIILDGENAWEYYPNDGNDFLNALYQKLSESEVLQTVTPSEYLKMFPEQRSLDELFPGAWFSANYDTWIGETEEAIAWEYLAQVREDLADYENGEKDIAPDLLAEAFDFMYLAEGSDWFWWYGADQDSGQDSYFDKGYRALLAGVYESLGEEVPKFVRIPIIQSLPAAAAKPFSGISSPEIDGVKDAGWDTAAQYDISGDLPIGDLYYTLDEENLYLRVDVTAALEENRLDFYFQTPRVDSGTLALTRDSEQLLGFNANLLLEWAGGDALELYSVEDGEWSLYETNMGLAALGSKFLEISVPMTLFGELTAGDFLSLGLALEPEGEVFPVEGPAQVMIPDMGEAMVFLEVSDPEGDDYGPGTYTYPSDVVFKESVFDAKTFTVGYDGVNLIMTFSFVGQLSNPWGSANGLSLQTLDVYFDTDPGAGTGARMLLPGRNAALQEGFGWEYAVWVEGWTPQVIQADPDTLEAKSYSEASSGMKVMVDAGQNAVTVRVPLIFFPEGNPADWAYAAVVLGQEGYPAEGVWRVRDVEQASAQYRFGGAPLDINHTRIIDLILEEGVEPGQAALLSDYLSSIDAIGTLSPDDFAQIPMLQVTIE